MRQFRIHLIGLVTIMLIAGCTVEPLNPKIAATSGDPDVASNQLSNVEIKEVSTRVAQQVRNQLIFGLNGGGKPASPDYSVGLTVTSSAVDLVVLTQTKSPTAAQVTVTASYIIRDAKTEEVIGTGTRSAIASYDRTSQSFANQRAERDAENRAAKEVAEILKFTIAQVIVTQPDQPLRPGQTG